MVWIIENVVTLVQEFVAVATSDPLSAILLAIGALLTGAASVAFGALAVGGILDALVPDVGSTPAQRGD